jgi:preprotein translocase subunit SecG
MGFIIGCLTFVLVVDCLFLILLILIQLPKKEAGMGTAFGGGTTDALFGAGTGNALTTMTRYAAIMFFVLALGLTLLNVHARKQTPGRLKGLAGQLSTTTPATPATTPTSPGGLLQSVPANTNLLATATNAPVATNAPAATNAAKPTATATNAPASGKK